MEHIFDLIFDDRIVNGWRMGGGSFGSFQQRQRVEVGSGNEQITDEFKLEASQAPPSVIN